MIPTEIAEIATLIFDGWSELDEDDKEDREALRSIFDAARRIHGAGYRRALTRDDIEGPLPFDV